jgi:tetratricopeptide (TPR) repeat protein
VLKLVDFGIAKSIGSAGEGHKLTRPGMVMGSPVYMSPEQCLGRKLDNRSDIYSLGCVMYECLTGKAPLVGETVVETLHKHVHESPRSFASVSPEFISIPEQLENIVFRCLEREPEKRYPTMLELWTDLELFQNSIKPAQTRITQTDLEAMKAPASLTSNPIAYVKENNTGLILIVVSLVLLGCVFTYSQLRPKEPEISEPEVAYAGSTEKAKKELAANHYDLAVKDYKEATRAAEKFDAQDPRLAEVLTELGRIYSREDFYPEAERAFKRALTLRSDIFGKTSLPAAESMADLGLVYCAEGYNSEAQEPLEEALKIRKQNAGDDSVDYAESLKDIALLYSRTGKEAEALKALQKAMAIRTKTRGSIDPSNIETQIRLAMAYLKKGDLAKAADLCNMAHRTALRSYDLNHPIVADALVGVAAVQSAEKKYDEAQKSYLEALEIRDKWFGKKSIKAAQVMLGMAANLEAQDKVDEAVVLYKEALQIEETTLGPGHPESKQTAMLYAKDLRALDREKDAEDLETRFGLVSARPKQGEDK